MQSALLFNIVYKDQLYIIIIYVSTSASGVLNIFGNCLDKLASGARKNINISATSALNDISVECNLVMTSIN